MVMPTTRFVLALLIVAALAVCARMDSESGRRFELTGTVAGRESSSARLMIAHDAIDGLMPAMNMPFEVRGAAPSLREGDRIAATLVMTRAQSWLENVRVTAAGSAVRDDVVTASHAAPGVVVPAFPLVNQDEKSLTLRDFAGRVLVITFVYTRCPLPDFCPLMVKHLESVRRRASKDHFGDRVALLGVTLDPEYDTPAVLRAYGESMLEKAGRFDQWTLATGSAAQVEAVARFFGVAARAEGGLVTHTLATAVIGHDSRIMRIFPSNSWRPDDLLAEVRRGVERAADR
jgi:protein SCO1/2